MILCLELKCHGGRIDLVILDKGRLDKVHRRKHHGADMNRKIINISQERDQTGDGMCQAEVNSGT